MIVTYAQKERINLLTSKETVKLIIDALEDKKAENIQIIDIRKFHLWQITLSLPMEQ